VRGFSFYAGGECFAVDVTLVEKVARNIPVTPVPAAPETVTGIANLKGRVITILDLAALFGRGGLNPAGEEPCIAAGTINAVIFKPFSGADGQMGLLIDAPGDLIDIEDEVILPPPAAEGEMLILSGMAEVRERLYRILNIHAIINRFKNGGDAADSSRTASGSDI